MGKSREPQQASKISKALTLRAAGASYSAIAAQVGYASKSGAFQAIQRELSTHICEDVAQLRRETLLTLEIMQLRLWAVAFPPDGKKVNLFAVDRLLHILELRARITGMDADPADLPSTTVVVREIPSNYLGPPGAIIEAE
jgi:hypothetical protein